MAATSRTDTAELARRLEELADIHGITSGVNRWDTIADSEAAEIIDELMSRGTIQAREALARVGIGHEES